jgi:hypothetical protein
LGDDRVFVVSVLGGGSFWAIRETSIGLAPCLATIETGIESNARCRKTEMTKYLFQRLLMDQIKSLPPVECLEIKGQTG